ncbi:hypothetical protein JOE21_002130 [Desmospora profundinema]|uniref:Uncharacterized protein n=1 Tax=Desmospora profundinema TaxID=1571184 RepID=A0ABU1IQC8_9BACL|nr:hypothetical protein [Desmospora profundinema]
MGVVLNLGSMVRKSIYLSFSFFVNHREGRRVATKRKQPYRSGISLYGMVQTYPKRREREENSADVSVVWTQRK